MLAVTVIFSASKAVRGVTSRLATVNLDEAVPKYKNELRIMSIAIIVIASAFFPIILFSSIMIIYKRFHEFGDWAAEGKKEYRHQINAFIVGSGNKKARNINYRDLLKLN